MNNVGNLVQKTDSGYKTTEWDKSTFTIIHLENNTIILYKKVQYANQLNGATTSLGGGAGSARTAKAHANGQREETAMGVRRW